MQFHIENMTCSGCVRSVTKAIRAVDPAAIVAADLSVRSVAVTTASAREAIEAALAEAGFSAESRSAA